MRAAVVREFARLQRPASRVRAGSRDGDLRVSVNEIGQTTYVDVRLFVDLLDDGDRHATRKGIAIREQEIDRVVAALVAAKAFLASAKDGSR